MKLLLDENLSPRLVGRSTKSFATTLHVDSIGLHGRPDREIWESARADGLVIVSKDHDFRQLSFLYGAPPKVVWLDVGDAGTEGIALLIESSATRVRSFVDAPEESLLVLSRIASR